MTQKLFDIGKGALLGGRVSILVGSGAPGLSDDTLSARPGSLYLDDLDGGSYRKVRTAAGTDKWELIGAGLSPKVVSGVQGLAVVDQSYAAESAVVKWLVDVTRTNDPASRYLTEITALHDGSAGADATRVDWNDYGVLHFGPAIDGLAIGVRLNGSGSAQVVELTVAAEVAVDVVVRRADLGLYLGAAEPLDISAAPHAATHADGGTDPLAIDAAQVISGTFSVARVPVAGSVPWDGVTGTPTTLAGYGISDAQAARATLGLGDAAVRNVGATAGTVAAGDHAHTLDAAQITSGVLDLARLPAAALERLVPVANQTARYALTTATVQLGDTVCQLDTGTMYLVVDAANLHNAAGYQEYTAGSAAAVPWSGVTGKPTTLGGYGITDAQPYNTNIQTHIASTANPHNTTAEQVGAMATSHAASAITALGGTPTALGSAAAGSATTVARSDHVHPLPSATDVGAAPASHSHPEYAGGGAPTALFPSTLPAQFTDSQGRAWLASGNTVPVSQAPMADAAVWGAAATDLVFTQRTSSFDAALTVLVVTYGNGLFVAAGDLGKLATSPDGVTWTQRTSGFGFSLIRGVTYDNGLFVAAGNDGKLATSSDGITWTQRTSGFGTDFIADVTHGNGLFVAGGLSGKLATSPDGVTWTQRVGGFGTDVIYGVDYGNGLFVAVGHVGKLATSADGITWTQRTSGFGTSAIRGVVYGNGLFVVVGHDGKLATSPDGITWTQRTSGFGAEFIHGVVYNNGLFVAFGASGKLATSPDGVTWTQRASGFGTSAIYGATYGDGLFVAVGILGKLATADAVVIGIPSVIDVGALRCYLRIA